MCTIKSFGAKKSLEALSKAKDEKGCQILPSSVARLPFKSIFFNFLVKTGNLATLLSQVWQHCFYLVVQNVNNKFFCPKKTYTVHIWPANVIFVDFLGKKGYLAILPCKIWQPCLSITFENASNEFLAPKNFFGTFFCKLLQFFAFFGEKWGSGNPVSKIWQPCLSMAFKNGTNNFIVLKNLNGTDFSNWYSFLEDFSEKNCNLATLTGWFWQPCLLDTFENVTIRFLVPKNISVANFGILRPFSEELWFLRQKMWKKTVWDEMVVDLSYMPFLLNQERVCVMGGGGGVEGDLIVLKSSNHLPAC